MIHEEQRLYRQRSERIARVKRWLRWMPRRTNVHRYPVLKWFAKAARKRSYLWCFRVRSAIPALYAGCILAMLPLYGVQLPLAALLAFALRANLPILATTQFITNPVTAVPLYFAAYQTGRVIFNLFGWESPHLNMAEMKALIHALEAGNWGFNIRYLWKVWLVTSLGGTILGTFMASVASILYRLAAYEVSVSYRRLRELQARRQTANPDGAAETSLPAKPDAHEPEASR